MDPKQTIAELWQQVLPWLDPLLRHARALPVDMLLLVIAWTMAVALVAFVWASRAARRAKVARGELAAVRAELEQLRADYEVELRWRQASETVGGRQVTAVQQPDVEENLLPAEELPVSRGQRAPEA